MVYDFHTHTTLSDGVLSPIELIRRSAVNGYKAVAITDHADTGNMKRIIEENAEACRLARSCWDIYAIPGIEITHVPAKAIAETARKARDFGAWLVVVHGESIVEPVEPGTNTAALQSPDVDMLAHPGLITLEETELAVRNGIYLEITYRKGHCLTNGYVASLAQKAGAKMLLNSDAHDVGDLLTDSIAEKVVKGTGLDDGISQQILTANPQELLDILLGKYGK